MSYARDTSVPLDRSKAELERLLTRAGADQFGYLTSGEGAMIAFRMHERQVRLMMPIPPLAEFKSTPTGRARASGQVFQAWEQAQRSRWRALVLIVKAKLEAVESGLSTFEREFLADVVLPDGRSVHEWLEPQIEEAYETAQMPIALQLALPAKT